MRLRSSSLDRCASNGTNNGHLNPGADWTEHAGLGKAGAVYVYGCLFSQQQPSLPSSTAQSNGNRPPPQYSPYQERAFLI
eukprot:540364-Rhodomonas_salina.1